MSYPNDGPLTTSQCAMFLGVSVQWLEAARLKGIGPPFVKMGRSVRYRVSSVLQWLIENEFQSTAEYSQQRVKTLKQRRQDNPNDHE